MKWSCIREKKSLDHGIFFFGDLWISGPENDHCAKVTDVAVGETCTNQSL